MHERGFRSGPHPHDGSCPATQDPGVAKQPPSVRRGAIEEAPCPISIYSQESCASVP